MKHERVYIAGKVTGLDRNYVIEKFEYWKQKLRKAGYIPVSPVDVIDENTSWYDAMDICLKLLGTCHKALFQKDWFSSQGAMQEMEFCKERDIPILSRYMINN